MEESKFTIKNQQVYCGDFLLKGVSPEGFEVIHLGPNQLKSILKDRKGIWWFYEFRAKARLTFLTEDINNFRIINDDYAKDKNSVYLIAKSAKPIPDSDPDTFMVFEDTPYFAKDKNNLYALNASNGLFLFNGADNQSLVSVGWGAYISDRDNLYHFGPPIALSNESKYNSLYSGIVSEQPEGETNFERNKNHILEKYPNVIGWWHPEYEYHLKIAVDTPKGYHQTHKAAYYVFRVKHPDKEGLKRNYTRIQKADVPSFDVLSSYYAKDKNHVYFQNRVVRDVDLSSFRIINNKLAEDDTSIFFNGYQVDCDKDSFEVLIEKDRDHSFEIVARDRNHVFIDEFTKFGKQGIRTGYDKTLTITKKIADPASFEIISDVWAKDEKHVYCNFVPQRQVDHTSFKFLFKADYSEWAIDKNHVYQNGEIVKHVHGGSFEVLNEFWGKDARNILSLKTGRVPSKIDAKTFKVIDDEGRAEDENFFYSFNSFGELKKKKK